MILGLGAAAVSVVAIAVTGLAIQCCVDWSDDYGRFPYLTLPRVARGLVTVAAVGAAVLLSSLAGAMWLGFLFERGPFA